MFRLFVLRSTDVISFNKEPLIVVFLLEGPLKYRLIATPSIRLTIRILSLISFVLMMQVIPTQAQSQEVLWKRYMNAAEQFRAKGDFLKDGQYLDQAITEIEKLARQQPIPRFTEGQKLDFHILVTNIANLSASQNIILNQKSVTTTQQEYEQIRKAECTRFQRVESAYECLFGSNAPETKYARTMLNAVQT
jgi:hypothetical protein